MELQKYMRGGLDVSEAEVDSLWTPYADAQRALDAERRERHAVEQIAGQALGYPWFKDDQKNFPGATEADGVCIGEHVAGTIVQELASKLAALQAQLAEIEQILCIESGKTTVDKVRDLHQSFKQVWNSYQSAVNELFDTQAQLRQVEGERTVDVANSLIPFKAGDWIRFKWFDGDAEGIVTGHNHGTVLFSNESVGSGFIELQNIVAHVSRANHDELTTLRQLVEAILLADERGQGLPFKEAMDAAAKAINWNSLPPHPTEERHE